MAKQVADQPVTVRLPAGARDRLVALTGQPFSRLMRFMVLELIKVEERKRAEASSPAAGAREEVKAEIASIAESRN